jgi:Carboxypeptidase regulatory-like domain
VPLLAATTLAAQRITGIVRDSVSGREVPGAVVSAFDSAGRPGLRTISDEFGRFAIGVPPGPAGLRVIRIGFAPRSVEIPASGERRTDGLEIRMLSLPALLTRVRVSDRAICPGAAHRSGALALWDQAQAGLLAAVVARQSRPGQMTVLDFVTDEDPDSRVVVKQSTRFTTGATVRPFVAVREAREFATHGYVARDGTALTFFGPDADVLLDEKFAATHCFGVVRDDRNHPGELGLSFAPAPGGRGEGFVDVDGTLWLDRDHPALRTLEFAFTGLDSAYREAGTRGNLVFRNMTNGLVYIERWRMYLPALSVSTSPGQRLPGRYAPGSSPATGSHRTVRVLQWRETGGEVVSAHWPDGSHAESSLGVVGGMVRDPDGRPLAGVRVRLAGTEMAAATDSSGRFTLSPVLPGRYGLDVVDSAYAPFVDPRRTVQLLLVGRDTLRVAPMVMHARGQAVNHLCYGDSRAPSQSAVVLGTVSDSSGPLATGTIVAASWMVPQPGQPTPSFSGTIEPTLADGRRFIVCRVPLGARLTLRIVRRDSTVADTSMVVGEVGVYQVNWKVKR